jgi:hypothetical protein
MLLVVKKGKEEGLCAKLFFLHWMLELGTHIFQLK